MGITPVIAAIGVGVAAGGAVLQYQGQQRMAAAQNDAQQAQLQQHQQTEALRQQQMNLDATRRQREIIRQGVQARAIALSSATGQGAQLGSGLQGGLGQIAGQTNANYTGVAQAQQTGNAIFGINRTAYSAMSSAYSSMASASGTSAFGSGMSSVGGALIRNAGTINSIGEFGASWLRGLGGSGMSAQQAQR